jgi:predicted MFS family arabinose efflux permease
LKPRTTVIVALACLYTAQGIPFGFATEYLPVVLREQGYSNAAIAALFWLQLPWQLKIFWAKAADHPRLRPRTRIVILGLQVALATATAAFALKPLREGPIVWFVLTAITATIAATQDVFVDAFAVRVLRPEERGYGNTSQVAGYRLGMLIGGAALLVLVGSLGERATLLACAGAVLAASYGAFIGSESVSPKEDPQARTLPAPAEVRDLVRHMFSRDARTVIVIALTYKLGVHVAASLLKPMAVDFGWSKHTIGLAVVSLGTGSGLAGAAIGGVLHRYLREKRALYVAMVIQALSVVPLILALWESAPLGLTTAAIAFEHFASGLGTTVLFAALMTATRPADAGLQYTILTSGNALAIGGGSMIGGLLADHAGKFFPIGNLVLVSSGRMVAFLLALGSCFLPLLFLSRWDEAARASRT